LIKLPKIQQFGATIISTKDYYEYNEEITFKFSSTDKGTYNFFIYKKENKIKKMKVFF
jgi:hypothetical protein